MRENDNSNSNTTNTTSLIGRARALMWHKSHP